MFSTFRFSHLHLTSPAGEDVTNHRKRRHQSSTGSDVTMAVQDLVLHFIYDEDSGGKQFYLPGDMLRGTIQLHLRRNLRVRTMT